MKSSIYIFSIFALVALYSCKNQASGNLNASEQVVTSGALPEDFNTFYQKFHQDSLYQMAHITWPLPGSKGLQVDSTTTGTQSTYWQPEEWRMMRLDLIESGDFIREINPIGDMLVVERIRAKAVPFGIERRFAKQANNEWELIFYADIFEFK
jgi:hypothetical protein